MENAQIAFIDASGGMRHGRPQKVGPNQYARGVNVAIVDELPTTRPGVRVIPISDNADNSAAVIRQENVQGSIFFNPAKGQGGIQFAASNAQIIVASGGRKISVKLDGRGAQTKAVSMDFSGQRFGPSSVHLNWLSAWEDLLIATDGRSPTLIWDGETAEYSRGYDSVDKERSEIPNAATVLLYLHGRGTAVVNSRYILVSDMLHKNNLTSSKNLREFTEQVYLNTGHYFVPPSSMGNITAAAILPLRNTVHGHGEGFFHTEDGIFSINTNVHPRSRWNEEPLVKHALLNTGATGPYAIALQDGDQIFRSRKGIQTIRSAAAESNLVGNPQQPISAAVRVWLDADYARWLRFASIENWAVGYRLLCTTQPVVQGRYRWHRGLVVCNTDPDREEEGTPFAWEGLWTLPSQIKGVIQLVNGIFDGEERMFAWCRGADGFTRLVEFDVDLTHDVLENGEVSRIRSQLQTRAIDADSIYRHKEFTNGFLYLKAVQGELDWQVSYRFSGETKWRCWRQGKVCMREDEAIKGGQWETTAPGSFEIPLGELPKKPARSGRYIQFLVRWIGRATIENVLIRHDQGEIAHSQFSSDKLCLACAGEPEPNDYDDHEYSDDPPWTES